MSQPLGPGRRLGPYRITALLGKGGMGSVWRATDEVKGGEVALKTLHAEGPTPNDVQRFLREARLASAIEHDHLVRVLFAGELDGQLVIAQELVTGGNLQQLIARGRLHWRDAVRLGLQMALGLGAIHRAGLIHRDLKPANVLLDPAGRVRIADFGLARHADRSTVLITAPGAILGTLEYMAPEQAGDNEEVTNRSDLYALGCTLHALLTGVPPFPGTGMTVIARHLGEAPKPPSARAPGVPPALDALVLRLLAKAQADRPASGEEVAQALHALLATGGRRTGERRAGSEPRSLRGIAFASAGLVAVSAVAAAAIALRPGGPDPEVASPASATTTTSSPPPPPRDPLAEARERYPDQLPWLRLVGVLGSSDLKTPGDATSLGLLPDGRAVTVGKALHLFDLATGRELARAPQPVFLPPDHDPHAEPPPLPPPDMAGAALLPDGRVATGGGDHLLAWDLSGPTPRAELLRRGLSLDSIAAAASAARVVGMSRSRFHALALDGGPDGDHDLKDAGGAVAVAPDGLTAWVATRRGVLQVDCRDVRKHGLVRESVRGATALAVSPDGGLLVAGHQDGTVMAWRVGGPAAPTRVASQKIGKRMIGTVAFSPEGDRIALTEWDAPARSNPTSGQIVGARSAWVVGVGPSGFGAPLELDDHAWMVSDARLGPGGLLVTLAMDHALRLFEAASGQPRLGPSGHVHWPVALALSPDEKTLVSGGMDGSLRVWDLPTRSERLAIPRAHDAHVSGLAWSATGDRLASCSVRGEVIWWGRLPGGGLELRARRPSIRALASDTTGVAVLGETVLLSVCARGGTGGGVLRRWVPPAEQLTPVDYGGSQGLTCLAPWNEHSVVLGTSLGEAILLELGGPIPAPIYRVEIDKPPYDPSETTPKPGEPVVQLATDPAGGRIAGTSAGVAGGRCAFAEKDGLLIPQLSAFPQQRGRIRGLVLQQGKGRLAASSSEDGSIKVWDTTNGQALATLELPTGEGDAPTALALTKDGRLYVGTHAGVILEYELREP